MNIITKQYAIDSVFIKEPWKELTYRDIQLLSKKKSRSYVYSAIDRLVTNRIVITRKVGKSILYSPNLNSPYVQNYMAFLEEFNAWASRHIPTQIISNLATKIFSITPFYTLIVTGSYAKKAQTSKSDLDIVFICDDKIDPQKINAELKLESELSIPKVHLYVFTRKQFLEMLSDKKENYGKEIARYHLIFKGGSAYYSILTEAIRNGFRG
jgi:predicted nucleotidyltransferase